MENDVIIKLIEEENEVLKEKLNEYEYKYEFGMGVLVEMEDGSLEEEKKLEKDEIAKILEGGDYLKF